MMRRLVVLQTVDFLSSSVQVPLQMDVVIIIMIIMIMIIIRGAPIPVLGTDTSAECSAGTCKISADCVAAILVVCI